jgi:predicted metal-dependent phosphoesterase TrpH
MGNDINRVDLHIHSTYSDGSAHPAEIVREAVRLGLRAVAVTDHDTIDGIEGALAAVRGARPPILFIPGVEISADHSCALHILGYFGAEKYRSIDALLAEMKNDRHIRNLGVLEKLNNLGIRIAEGEVAEIAGKKIFGRPHIAAAMIRRGIVPTQASAFNEYLSGGRKAYVKKRSRSPEECVSAIADAGGLPVIAHPAQTGLRLGELASLAKSLVRSGLFGIEAYYPEHTSAATGNFKALADSLGLLTVGGSDFHGDYRPRIRLGTGKDGNLRVPDDVPHIMMEALAKK